MKISNNALHFILPALLCSVGTAQDAPIMDKTIMDIAYKSAVLSAVAYDNSTLYATATGFEHPDFDEIKFYTEEPDQAVLAVKDGKCFLAFRGTNFNLEDWQQNADLADRNIYLNNDTASGEFCEARAGFADFLDTDVVFEGLVDLQACVAECADECDCLVLTGHSQGGATATVASILLNSRCPTIVTFGQPPAVDGGCEHIPSDRLYRFVNSKQESDLSDDLGFDPVPYAPAFISKSKHYGYFLQLGDDETAMKYLGFDASTTFIPSIFDKAESAAHSMGCVDGTPPYSYECRIAALLATAEASNTSSVSTDGFINGVFCEPDYSELCVTGRCTQEFECADTLQETCVKGACELDSDCASGSCIWDSCADGEGMVADGCPCGLSSDCASKDCDITSIFNLDWICDERSSAAAGIQSAGVVAFLAIVGFALF